MLLDFEAVSVLALAAIATVLGIVALANINIR